MNRILPPTTVCPSATGNQIKPRLRYNKFFCVCKVRWIARLASDAAAQFLQTTQRISMWGNGSRERKKKTIKGAVVDLTADNGERRIYTSKWDWNKVGKTFDESKSLCPPEMCRDIVPLTSRVRNPMFCHKSHFAAPVKTFLKDFHIRPVISHI